MNENLNLVEILKDCPKGTKLYSMIHGDVEVKVSDFLIEHYTKDGRVFADYLGECVLFPSKEQRDWSKFKLKQPKFDPNTLHPFDKVLVRDRNKECWRCGIFSFIIYESIPPTYQCIGYWYRFCIPYNEETKHLVGTKEEAPEYYRYWED